MNKVQMTTRALLVLLLAPMLGGCSGKEPGANADAQQPESRPAVLTAPLEPLDPPAGPGALAPNLTRTADGTLLTWLEPGRDRPSRDRPSRDRPGRDRPSPGDGPDDAGEVKIHRLLLATLSADGWSPPRQITDGEGLFANWADLPAVAAGNGGDLVAHWLGMLGDATYAYGVQLARSSDGGDTWQPLGLLHDDDSPTEHGFVSYVPAAAGIHAFWLDGRGMLDEGPMELRTALLGGGSDEPVPASTLLDGRVCECCATDAAMTSAGPIVVYRDRDDDEVRDVSVVRATGDGWSEPRTLHADGWQIHGCPVNGPAVAAQGERVAVAWFTVVDETPRVQLAFSGDAGSSFGAPTVVDGETPLGHVDVGLNDDGAALVSWLGTAGEGAEIRLRRVTSSGELGPVRVVAETTTKRSAGVPRMVRDGDRLIFAWVEDAKPSRLRVGVLSRALQFGQDL